MRTRRSWRNQERMWKYLGGTDKVPFLPAIATPREPVEWKYEEDKSPLFIGVFPCGLGYADTRREEHGDYVQVAFLPYSTLVLKVDRPKSDLLEQVQAHAAGIIAKRGENYRVSGCGQTVLLGDKS